jgi:hypothetical protein
VLLGQQTQQPTTPLQDFGPMTEASRQQQKKETNPTELLSPKKEGKNCPLGTNLFQTKLD